MKTHDLEKTLNKVEDEKHLDSYLKKIDSTPSSFLAYFSSLKKVNAMDISELVEKSGIERTYGYHILSGTKTPGRDKIIRFCLAAGLNSEETRRSLESGKEAPLYAKSKRDALLQYSLNKHLSVIDTNILLVQHGEDPLD